MSLKQIDIADLDCVYLSYDEPAKEEFWVKIRNMVPWATRVDGVRGSDAAHKAAAASSSTERFILIDGDNLPDPEFFNQKMVDIMPILFGLIITPDGGKLFDGLFKIALKLPDRFHRWYGDQMAIAQEWIKNKENYLLLKQEEYLFVTRTSLKKIQLKNLIKNGVKIITFKGPHSKQFIPETLKELINE